MWGICRELLDIFGIFFFSIILFCYVGLWAIYFFSIHLFNGTPRSFCPSSKMRYRVIYCISAINEMGYAIIRGGSSMDFIQSQTLFMGDLTTFVIFWDFNCFIVWDLLNFRFIIRTWMKISLVFFKSSWRFVICFANIAFLIFLLRGFLWGIRSLCFFWTVIIL